MAFSEFEAHRLRKIALDMLEVRRPPVHVRDQVDINVEVDGQSVVIVEERAGWRPGQDKIRRPCAKITYVKSQDVWKLYWMRANLKWDAFKDHEHKSLEAALQVVVRDENACFFG